MKQKIKKLTSLILSLIMVISMMSLSTCVFAESNAGTVKMRLDVPKEPVDYGQTIQVPVVVENIPISGIDFSVDYDETILEFVSYTESVFLSYDSVPNPGTIIVAGASVGVQPIGVIGVINFKVISNNNIAETVSLDLSVNEALDEDDNNVSGGFNASFSFEKAGYSITADENGNCAVTGYTGKATELVIPSEIDGYTVTSIGESAFNGCISLTTVTIPDSVTSIGKAAFANCSSLTSVTIPDNVTSIGESAFAFCESLASVTIPDSMTSIGNSVFKDCTSLTSVTIPDSVTSIGEAAFSGCTSLANVTIPDSVMSIGEDAFNGTSLVNVTIPESVTSIGDRAFIVCDSSLTSVTIPKSVTTIGAQAFGYTHNEEICGVKKIDDFTVYGYRNTVAKEYANENGFKFVSLDRPEIGDVNNDGQITTVDAKLILKSLAGLASLNDMQKTAADINKDNRIQVVDAKWILQIIAGLRDETTLELK